MNARRAIKSVLMKLPYGVTALVDRLRGIRHEESSDVLQQRQRFYGAFLHKNDLVFDIGANYGNRVQTFLSLGCKVVAVEPLPECFRYLKYKYGRKARLENICVGPARTEAQLSVGRINVVSTLSTEFMDRTIESGRFDRDEWQYKINVQVLTLDDLISKYGMPRFIKLDTEGYEREVIKGLSGAANFMSFEYTLPEFRKELLEILVDLEKRGKMVVNVSVGEQMQFLFEEWMSGSQFLSQLNTNEQRLGAWGDIYVQYK